MTPTRRHVLVGLGGFAATAAWSPRWRTPLVAGDDLPITYDHVPAMGTRVSFAVRHPDARHARHAIRRAVREIFVVHEAMTLHEPSPITFANEHALSRAVEVPETLWEVLLASRDLHARTEGLFDAAMGRRIRDAMARPWDLHHPSAPGWHHVHTDATARTVRFSHPDVALDVNGIAKGYAVDRAVAALRAQGIDHLLVNAGGDIRAVGSADGEGSGWPVELVDPRPGRAPAHTLRLVDGAIATSGNTFRPKGADGRPVGHLVHPDDGGLAARAAMSTACAPTAMAADAWATAAFVASPERLARLLQAPDSPRILLTDAAGRVTETRA